MFGCDFNLSIQPIGFFAYFCLSNRLLFRFWHSLDFNAQQLAHIGVQHLTMYNSADFRLT